MTDLHRKNVYTGIGFAMLATIIWSGNFVIARGLFNRIPPASLAFYRWLIATIVIFPFAYRHVKNEWPLVKKSAWYLLFASLTGIAVFNTLVYIGAHYTSAINLALIGTTSSPIIAVILARIFLKEQITLPKFVGLILCVTGILLLLCRGDFSNLLSLTFGKGDLWVLAAGFSFAIYNTLVKKKPVGISAINFLFVVFAAGTFMLMPFWFFELRTSPQVVWDHNIILAIAYLAIGASVISFLLWNIAIGKLGAGRTALFGNLIPIFSIIEAALILNEAFTWVHAISMVIVFTGIVIANFNSLTGGKRV